MFSNTRQAEGLQGNLALVQTTTWGSARLKNTMPVPEGEHAKTQP